MSSIHSERASSYVFDVCGSGVCSVYTCVHEQVQMQVLCAVVVCAVHTCVCMSRCGAGAGAHARVYVGQRSKSGVFLNFSLPCFVRKSCSLT